jgi:hypothetical protein
MMLWKWNAGHYDGQYAQAVVEFSSNAAAIGRRAISTILGSMAGQFMKCREDEVKLCP